jgi:hypothetical protein
MHREVDQGTLRGVLRQANVAPEEFVENLDAVAFPRTILAAFLFGVRADSV